MQVKKPNVFKMVNVFMAVICIITLFANQVNVDVLSEDKATSVIGNDVFEYHSSENTFSLIKNGNLFGTLKTDKKIKFQPSKLMLKPHAVFIAGKLIAAGFAAAAAGGSFAAGIMAALPASLGGGAAIAGAGAAACVEVPGAAAVAATLGGAGEVAAAAAAAEAAALAGGGMAVLSAVLVPVLIGLGVGSVFA